MSKLKRKVTVDAVSGKSDDRKKPSVFERLGPNAVSVRRSVGNFEESESEHEDFVKKCRNWVSTGACSYGNKCKFLHEPFPGASKSSKGRDEESQDLRLRVKRKKDKNLDKSDSEESQERDRLQSKKEKLGGVKSAIVLKKPGAGSDSDTPEQWSGEDLDYKKELELEKRRQQLQRELSQLEDEEDVGGRENFKIEKKLQKESSSNSDSTENRSRSRSRKMGKKKKSKRSKHSKSPSKSKLARSSSASNDSDETHRKHKKKSKKAKSHEMHSDGDRSPEPEQKTRKLLSPLKFKKLNKAVISKTITAFHSSEEEEAPPPPKMNLPMPSRSPIHPGLPQRLPDVGVLRTHSSDDEKSHRMEKSTKDKRSVTPKKKKERKLSPEFVKESKVEKMKGAKRVVKSKSRSRSASGDRRSSFSPDGKKSKKLEKKKRQKKEEHELVKDASFERSRVRQEHDGKEKDGTPMSDYRDFSPGQGVVKKKKDKKKDKKKKERDVFAAAEEVERKRKKSKAKDRDRSESPDSRKKEKRSLERVSHREIDMRTLSPSVKGARDPYQDRRGIKALESTSRGDRERDVRDPRDAREDSRDVRPETRERESRTLRDAREIRDPRERDSREPRADRDARDPRDTRSDVREPRETRSDVRESRDNRSDVREPREVRDPREPRSDGRDSRSDVRDPREREIRDREPRERIDMREGRDARERDLREPHDDLRELRETRDTREREIRDRLVPGREFALEPTREIPLLDRDPSLDRRERYLPDDRFRDEPRRDRYDDPRLAALAIPGFDDRVRYPRSERDGFVDLVDRPPPFVRPERDMVDRRDLGDRRGPLELPFEGFVPNRVDLRYGDGPMRGGLRLPFDLREQGPGWDRGQGRSRGGWSRGGPPDRGGRYDDRNRREWDNSGRPDEFFGPDRRDWPDRRQTDRPDDRKDAVRGEGRDKRKDDKQDADREKDGREKEIGWNKESTQDKDRDKDREKDSARGEKESIRDKDGKDKDSVRDDKTDKKSTRNADTKDDRKDERDRDKKEDKLDKDDSKRRDRDRDQQDQSDVDRKDRKRDDDKLKDRKDDDRKEKVKEKDKVETKLRDEDRDSDRRKDEDRKKNDDDRERSRKRRASRDGSASPSGKKPRDGSPALSTHSKRSAREPAIDRQFFDVDIHSDKGSIAGSERSRSRRRGKDDEKRLKKGKDSEDHNRKRSRSHDGSEVCSNKRRKLDIIYPEGEGQLAGFVIKDTVGSDKEENPVESLEQNFSDWTTDSDDDILNRPADLNKVIEPTQDKENKRDKRSSSPHGSVCSHHSQKMKPKEESTEDIKDVKKSDNSEEMAELESISSDEGSLLANVKTAAVDALQIDWSSLMKDERPKPITGSALQRFKPGYLFSKMGISRQYAGEELHGEVLSVCQKYQEQQAAESNARVGQENDNKGNVAQDGIKTGAVTAQEDKPFKFLSDVAMFHSNALQKLKQRKQLVSNIGPFRRALCARRDLEMRRQLCKLDKVLDASQLYASHEVDTDLYRQSIQILKQVNDSCDKLPTGQKDSNSACQKTLPVEVTCS